MLLVIFTRPLEDVFENPAKGWMLSVPYPKKVRAKLVAEVTDRLYRSKRTRRGWIVDVQGIKSKHIDPSRNMSEHVYGIGALYLRPEFRSDTKDSNSGSMTFKEVEERMTHSLKRDDIGRLRDLFSSLSNHQSGSDGDYPRHFHHFSYYWVHARDKARGVVRKDVFEREHTAKALTDDISPSELRRMLLPVFREIDAFYCELRGGIAGKFDEKFDTRIDSGAPMLMSRHRKVWEKERGIRPPTIAFYFLLRAPKLRKKGGRTLGNYRIVPIVTASMCLDLAATLVGYKETNGESSEEKIFAYLEQMGVSSDAVNLNSIGSLAKSIEDAMNIENFLSEDSLYHSMTYPAYSSGLLSVIPATPCSKADRHAFGPDDFLLDKELAEFCDLKYSADNSHALVRIAHYYTRPARDGVSLASCIQCVLSEFKNLTTL